MLIGPEAIQRILDGIEGHKIEIERGCGFRWRCSCRDFGHPQPVVDRALMGALSHIEGIRHGSVLQGTAVLS